MKTLRKLLFSLALWGLCLPVAWAMELADLMALMAQNQRGEAHFVEQRWVNGLTQPLQSRGTLSFHAPSRFSRITLEPSPESMTVDGRTVTLKRAGRSRTLSLDSVPEVAAIVEAVRGTLTGDLSTLQQYFNTTLSGHTTQWVLVLEPLDARLAAQVSQVRITGEQRDLRTVEVKLADGDSSLMRIESAKLAP